MFVPDSFEGAYNVEVQKWEEQQSRIDAIFAQIKKKFTGVHYEPRIKSLESIFIKSQQCNYDNPLTEMEDFFACTLVIPNLSMIMCVQDEVAKHFDVIQLPPRGSGPYDFGYNDLHLHLSLRDGPPGIIVPLSGRKFELQIKTMLQSAWSKAGHDIIYKPDKISWGAERVSGQMRALLELADGVLAQIEETAALLQQQSDQNDKIYKSNLKQIIGIMGNYWNSSDLPSDRRRMALIVMKYLEFAGINTEIDKLDELLSQAKKDKHRVLTIRVIPPIQKVFILLFESNKEAIKKKLRKPKNRVLITPEMIDFFPYLKEIEKDVLIVGQ